MEITTGLGNSYPPGESNHVSLFGKGAEGEGEVKQKTPEYLQEEQKKTPFKSVTQAVLGYELELRNSRKLASTWPESKNKESHQKGGPWNRGYAKLVQKAHAFSEKSGPARFLRMSKTKKILRQKVNRRKRGGGGC